MHVLIVPSWYPGNAEDIEASFIREQAQALVRYGGHEVGVIFPLSNPLPWPRKLSPFDSIEILREENVSTYRSHALSWFRRVPYLGLELWIREGMRLYSRYVEERGKPDVIHAHVMFYGGLLARRIAEKYLIPFVMTEHNSGYARGFVKPWQLALGAKAVRASSRCIAVGRQLAELLDHIYELPQGTWQVVPNLVSSHFFEVPINPSPLRERNELRFCTICALNGNKGVDLLIRAFGRSIDGRKNIYLMIGGEGSERSALEYLAGSLGLSDQIRFLGELSRDRVVDVIADSDGFILSSHYETFSIVLAEALALGKPVIATRCGGPESIVRPIDGFLVDRNDEGALADAMKKMFREVQTFDVQEIRSGCLRRYGASVVVSRLTEIYREVVGQAG